jgi:hypothetical protein
MLAGSAAILDPLAAYVSAKEVLTLLALLVQKYKSGQRERQRGGAAREREEGGTQFTCFTGTKVQILTQLRQEEAYPRAEPLDWEAEAPENSGMSGTFVLVKQALFFFRQGSGLGGRGA